MKLWLWCWAIFKRRVPERWTDSITSKRGFQVKKRLLERSCIKEMLSRPKKLERVVSNHLYCAYPLYYSFHKQNVGFMNSSSLFLFISGPQSLALIALNLGARDLRSSLSSLIRASTSPPCTLAEWMQNSLYLEIVQGQDWYSPVYSILPHGTLFGRFATLFVGQNFFTSGNQL